MKLYQITVTDGDKEYTGDFWEDYETDEDAKNDALEYYKQELGNDDIQIVSCILVAK